MDKPIEVGSSVNILYLTTKCNIACTYCYEELSKKEKKSTSLDELKKQVDDIISSEPVDKQTLFVLFGGEPTLEWDNIKSIVDYTLTKKKNVFFNLETNGIKFLNDDFLNEYLNFFKNKPHSLDISFDGIGNYLRIGHDGVDTTFYMLDILEKFRTIDINWRIRYTITKANYKEFASDIIHIIKYYNPKRVITGEDSMSFSKEDYIIINKQKDILYSLWNEEKIDVPVCSIFCDNCTGCSSNKETKRYYSHNGMVSNIKVSDNQDLFNHFELKKGK